MGKYDLNWDLEQFYAGGSQSQELQEDISRLRSYLAKLERQVSEEEDLIVMPLFGDMLIDMQEAGALLNQITSFVVCLMAQNVKDDKARMLWGDLAEVSANFDVLLTKFAARAVKIPDNQWDQLLVDKSLEAIAFWLNERRNVAKEKMDPRQEVLVSDLEIDGFHAWNQLYDELAGQLSVVINDEGHQKQISIGQAANLLSDSNRQVRQRVFAKYESAWEEKAPIFAKALNHLAGFRLQVYKHRGWHDVLKESHLHNRISADTLDAMWDVISQNKGKLVKYLERKAELLGLSKLDWYDVDAPVGQTEQKIPFDQAGDFVVKQFRTFSPELAEFCQMALENRWVEGEDRSGKEPGAYCTTFPISKQSRVFMTYSGTPGGVSTLAHELGHAYHSYVLRDEPVFAQEYPMNLAETASTLGEIVVADAAIKAASTKEEQIALLEDKIQRAQAFFMNIHARFLFETRFYQRRKRGLVSITELNELMLLAQKEAYCDGLGEYHPYFWASKLHFFISQIPFYNYPYTMGYLFSNGVYARALAEGEAFAAKYRGLLRDTGRMTVADLAAKHLGADISKPDFWQQGVDLVLADVDKFLELTK